MSGKRASSFLLKAPHREFLRETAKKLRLDDHSMALRCLVDFAPGCPDLDQAIFAEIHSRDC